MKIVNTTNAPKAVGPYSQAVVSNGLVFCAGQISLNPETGELAGDNIESQTKQVLNNITQVLKEAGTSLEKAVNTTCYLRSMDDYLKFNETYASFFTEDKPARTTIEVSRLPKDALVEIALVAEI